MIPVSLKLHNFMSYGEGVEPLDFGDFSVACLSGQNGHGKSALLDAITWALWGEARKAAGQKKPDEGLLRLGTGEMLVELVFDLEGERFRVIRSFRKTGKTGRSALELNVYQPEKGEYVSVTGSSISDTQRKINQFLRMDYQTFINSSFLLQGRADEFTKKNASERKKILSDILGLGKYEEMASLAREQYNAARDQLLLLEGELNNLSREAANEQAWRERLQKAKESLQAADGVLKAEEQTRQTQQQRLQELNVLAARSAALQAEQSQRLQEQSSVAAEITRVRGQLNNDRKLLANQEKIMLGMQRLQAVEDLLAETISKLKRLRSLEQQASVSQAQIEQEKLSLQKDAAQWSSRLRQISTERRRAETVLDRREEIKDGYRQLLALQEEEEAMEAKRQEYDAALLALRQIEFSVEQVRASLQAEANSLGVAVAEGERRLKEVGSLQAQQQEIQTRLATLSDLAKEMESVKEQGTACALAIQRLQDEITRNEERQKELAEKLELLRHSHGASCPLCEHPLDEHKQHELRLALQTEKRQLSCKHRQLQADLQKRTSDRDTLRARYAELAQRSKLLPEVQRSLADIEANLQQLSLLETDIQQKRATREKLTLAIERGDFASEEMVRLSQQQQRLASIGYEASKHQQQRQTLKRLENFKVQMHQLRDAEQVVGRLDQEAAEVAGKLEHCQQQLESGSYADQARTELEITQLGIAQLGYDPSAHQRLEQEKAELQPFTERYRELTVAQERIFSLEQNLVVLQAQSQTLEQKLLDLSSSITELDNQLRGLPALEQQLSRLVKRISEARSDYEKALTEQIEAKSGLDRCLEAQSKRVQLEKKSSQVSRERLIYEKLVAAFGKDGIPALIIENAIPEIEELANEVLDRLTGGRARITIEPLRDKKSGGTKETLDIRISDEMGTRDYELFSGGEAFRTDFAIRMALSKLLARRAGTRLQTLVIDEGFGTQDAEGLEHMVEAIQSIREDFEKIVVVTHLDALKNAFPVRIEVVKHPETGSQLRVVHL